MSAFLVYNSTINTIVTFLANHYPNYLNLHEFDKLSCDLLLQSKKDCQKLASHLFFLNWQSLLQRYDDAEDFFNLDEHYAIAYEQIIEPNHFQILKHLQCFLYQSCEGTNNTDPLYLAIDNLRFFLTCYLIDLSIPTLTYSIDHDSLPKPLLFKEQNIEAIELHCNRFLGFNGPFNTKITHYFLFRSIFKLYLDKPINLHSIQNTPFFSRLLVLFDRTADYILDSIPQFGSCVWQ